MKKQLLLLACVFTIGYTHAQQIATFEDLGLGANTYWNGSTQPGGTTFTSGGAVFPNMYDSSWGGYWAGGWAYSSINDSSTSGYTNMYAAKALTGQDGSGTYAVGQNKSIIRIPLLTCGCSFDFQGVYITNSTYAANSMRDGDSFAKKFGGSTGNDPDWMKLVINKYKDGLIADTVQFYLADYRFTNNSQDYIVTDWKYVDLKLSTVLIDSIEFTLSSSDTGSFGMNTPAFFCIDNVKMLSTGLKDLSSLNNHLTVSPNPAHNQLTIGTGNSGNAQIELLDYIGKTINTFNAEQNLQIDIANLPKGIYFVRATSNDYNETIKFVKE